MCAKSYRNLAVKPLILDHLLVKVLRPGENENIVFGLRIKMPPVTI